MACDILPGVSSHGPELQEREDRYEGVSDGGLRLAEP